MDSFGVLLLLLLAVVVALGWLGALLLRNHRQLGVLTARLVAEQRIADQTRRTIQAMQRAARGQGSGRP